MILVIAEQRDGKLNRASWEAIAGAQLLAGGAPLKVVVAGGSVSAVAQELATAAVVEVITVEDAALGSYTPDGFVQALTTLIDAQAPEAVVLAHTYQTRDFAPMLAARLHRALITDITGVKGSGA